MRSVRYLLEYRNVFSERLKTAVDVDCRICSGSEFQTQGPAKQNARRP